MKYQDWRATATNPNAKAGFTAGFLASGGEKAAVNKAYSEMMAALKDVEPSVEVAYEHGQILAGGLGSSPSLGVSSEPDTDAAPESDEKLEPEHKNKKHKKR